MSPVTPIMPITSAVRTDRSRAIATSPRVRRRQQQQQVRRPLRRPRLKPSTHSLRTVPSTSNLHPSLINYDGDGGDDAQDETDEVGSQVRQNMIFNRFMALTIIRLIPCPRGWQSLYKTDSAP